MHARSPRASPSGQPDSALRQLGLVVHPNRSVEAALEAVRAWALANGVRVGQIPRQGQTRQVADFVEAAACDLLLGLGGDGTTLSALHAGAPGSRPVLGVACGSVGALTSVRADRVAWALDQVAAGSWTAVALPALDLAWGQAPGEVAINDVAIVRDGPGQVIISITVDGVLYAELAGDGLVVATALGSSAYTMAAGGPLLAPGAEGMVITPLAAHGGSCPPLVAGSASRLTLTVEAGYGGVRCELDGRRTAFGGPVLTLSERRDYARLTRLDDEEPRLTALRRRGLVLDSPRAVLRDIRKAPV